MKQVNRNARDALAAGDPQRARHLAAGVLSRDAANAEAHFLLGVSEATLGNIRGAITHLQAATELEQSAEYWAQLARCLLLLRRDGEAATALRAAEECLLAGRRADALTHDTIGCAYARLGEHAASLPHFSIAVKEAPGVAQFRYNQAVALSFIGRVDEAEAAFEELLKREPDHARGHHTLAGLRRQTAERNHIPRLLAAHGRARAPESRLLLGYALAKEYEEAGEAGEGFRWLAQANAEHRAHLPYSFTRDEEVFDAIEENWPVCAAAPAVNPSGEAPIFVIGMPRTGTTLVDRILSSHPRVVSAGELQAFPLAVKFASGTRTRVVLDPETVRHASATDMAVIGRAYLERARHHVPSGGERFCDKFPGNFFYAGMIARALPNARIVCLRRHPMDTVLSNFKNLFATTSRYYDYSYSIEEIARYYVRFDRLMRFWQSVLPGRVLEVGYEDLVGDQEAETRRLLAHCGLEWSEACLNFHANAAPVSTPSAAQVRRPIYRDSVARWRRHERELEPARLVFAQAGIDVL
ncbi:tetratricopeptide repeat-containing sulfotransferase family protein [Gluconacetobacter sp. Hr-1-5]|uniref:tetratricopeptide repeat-containing sulfotransferase family protein n=1 Tax=Gluconacetobacter sp. Hr-1-5 TaxID=3395370 RepID=UPI003B520F8F